VKLLLVGALLLAASPARPDLTESAVNVPQRTVQAGGSVRVTDVLRNLGLGVAPRSTTAYYLSPGHMRLGQRSAVTLQPRANSRRSVTLRIPGSVVPGRYRVRACADDRRRIRESNEANNCRAAPRLLTVTRGVEKTPPRFGGLKAATTCIPGPVGEGRTAAYHLRWDPATDDVTPASAIAYDVYQATTSGGEDLSAPAYTTEPGEVSFTTPLLPTTKTYYFVVRARDHAGNRDSNRIERQGVNLCL
jgi:CARDB